ncbi:E3 ubiquitin-protein ligase RNF4-like isoform X1 [Vigna umbellata]|uniref:E3 ubiquitin-protein ligase RNF4-like isoform X1 n=1 Tax=Vigna umbellata TaxID=87088 RepID=UPI001F5E773E|nr:E3 ubiquitin-protein ligase RNF4-like isoform X1 [Vigna umbellata]
MRFFLLLLGYGSSVPMSSRTGKGPAVRSYRRRKAVLDLDLNLVPASDNREHEGPSTQSGPLGVIVEQQPPASQPTMIDVEDIDDDVVECTPGAFAEAKNKSRRIRGRTIVDVELEDQTRRNKRRRELRNQTIINCEKYINLEGSSSSMSDSAKVLPEPRIEPVFNCPICMGPLAEEMSTRCGHIFCKNCIKAAISAQGKCPTCRKKITVKELIRVFLPSTS